MAADRAEFFIPRPRAVCSISFSGVANITETTWIILEIEGAARSVFIRVFLRWQVAGNESIL